MELKRIKVDKGLWVYQRQVGGIFYLDMSFRGSRRRVSLGTRQQEQAIAAAKSRRVLQLREHWQAAVPGVLSVETAIAHHTKQGEADEKSATWSDYEQLVLKRFVAFMKERRAGRVALADSITAQDVQAFRDRVPKLAGRGVSPSTVNKHVDIVSEVFAGMVDRHWLLENPCAKVKRLKGITVPKVPLSRDEWQSLSTVAGPLLRDLCVVLLATGFRLGEATHLRRVDVILPLRRVFVRSRPDYRIKDRQERYCDLDSRLWLADEAMTVLSRRTMKAGADDALLFPNEKGHVFDNRDLLRKLHEACREAKIRRITFYLLRHTYATEAMPILGTWALTASLGHSSPLTTDRNYGHLGGRQSGPIVKVIS